MTTATTERGLEDMICRMTYDNYTPAVAQI
jgi:hypothetical protein